VPNKCQKRRKGNEAYDGLFRCNAGNDGGGDGCTQQPIGYAELKTVRHEGGLTEDMGFDLHEKDALR